jgi:hypothetical protein
MKVVNVVTQQQWDCVSKELGYEWWHARWNNFKGKTCINIKEIGCNYIKWYKEQNATILTFEQWVLEHCREKYKGNPIVKSLYNDLSASIDSNSLWIQGIVGVLAKTNAINIIALTLFDFNSYQFATIEKSIEQPEQRKVIGYATPIDMYGGRIKKSTLYKSGNAYWYYPNGDDATDCFLPAELVEAYFTPIYEKTEAEIQAETIDEMTIEYGADTARVLDSQFITWLKNQTKFKIVRNEN